MRGTRRFLGAALAASVLLVTPVDARANGGAYLEFDRTHYLPGDAGVATTYVSLPRKKMSLFDRGPFYLFAVPNGMSLVEGHAIPEGAIRIGTFTVEEEKNAYYELRAEFTAPQLASAFYVMALCNDPCTISGFREPLSGTISIVATRREAELLTQTERLQSRLFGVRYEARKIERHLERLEGELDTHLAFGASERERMTEKIERFERQLASARERAVASSGRAPFDPWVVGAILLVTLVAAALAVRRRRMLPALTDL
jgi:hypothetical protein